jgi:hypothetical protein
MRKTPSGIIPRGRAPGAKNAESFFSVSGLMMTRIPKNPDGFISSFGSDDPHHKEEVF